MSKLDFNEMERGVGPHHQAMNLSYQANRPPSLIPAMIFALFVWLFSIKNGHAQSCFPAPAGCVAWWPGEMNGGDIQNDNDTSVVGATFRTAKVSKSRLIHTKA